MPDASDDNRWGTVFMGPTPDRESTIDRVTEDRQRELWNRRTEAEYMERVRAKATLRVQAMLDEARVRAEAIRGTARQWAEKLKTECEGLYAQAEKAKQEAEALRAEAGALRESAREEGYALGVEQAFLELDEHRTALDEATASVLKTIESQSAALFEAWRRDLAELLRDAVETSTGWVLTEERTSVLEALLSASVQELTDRRRLTIKVNPQDSDAVTLVIESAKARFPDLQSWEVRADESVEPAGLVVESASGVVDNRREVRRQVVADVLRHLTLPPGTADAAASAAVAAEMERTGMNALAAEAEERSARMAAEAALAGDTRDAPDALDALDGAQEERLPLTAGDGEGVPPPDAGDGSGAVGMDGMSEPAGALTEESAPPDGMEGFPELQGVELPPDFPAQAAPRPELPPGGEPFPVSPAGTFADLEPAREPVRTNPSSTEALPEDEGIPVLDITVGEPDADAVETARLAEAAAAADEREAGHGV